jgi:ABC-2 type transport system ATP-binding protein
MFLLMKMDVYGCRPGAAVEFRLLGPVEVWAGGHRIDLGPQKQRFVLAVLALQVNRLVPVDRLVDLTWGEAPPPSARHAIHDRVSRIRGALAGAGWGAAEVEIVTRGSTYALRADPMKIDAHRFRACVAWARQESSDEKRAYALRRALALWHGPPLADVATPSVDHLRLGLEEARLAALEECFDAELRLGQHGGIIDQLMDLAGQHPYRQRLVALLMLALYRDGRAPDALLTYQLIHDRLMDEFGLDPHIQLQQLASAILRGDPALDLAPVAAASRRS